MISTDGITPAIGSTEDVFAGTDVALGGLALQQPERTTRASM
jgi:hypothetical protein